MSHAALRARAEELRSARTPFVSATVVRAERPTSAHAGDRALVLPDGSIEGFVGGACAEATVRVQALRLLAGGDSVVLRITPEDPELAEPAPDVDGLITAANPCLSGGTLDIFLEPVIPPVLVVAFGDAPVARALAAVGSAAGLEVRAMTDSALAIPPDAAAVVVASHGRDEEAVLAAALRSGVPYIGLIASRRRGAAVLAELELAADERARIHTPAGLDIGAHTPGEIALSVLAQIVADRPQPPVSGREVAEDQSIAEAIDPVCGMTVAVTADAQQFDYRGTTWYFCGSGCREAFAANPTGYAR